MLVAPGRRASSKQATLGFDDRAGFACSRGHGGGQSCFQRRIDDGAGFTRYRAQGRGQERLPKFPRLPTIYAL